ncbi:Peptidase S41 family protein [Lachnellula subtilissima]|uniref:Peptidase S41 family protein n=1 Tax=Lachnellula subtilissima TaxID=602034 RepID=A0A8H8RME1_9HELO|nr:Peptidase S41 family protein [Lachnellula subtilissima]
MARFSFTFHALLSFCVALSRAAPSNYEPPTVTKRAATPISTVCGDIIRNAELVFPAKQAYDCLTSVPFNAAVATRFLQYYNDTIQFQSNLAYLKNPPASYQQAPVDLVEGLAQIQIAIDNSKFANQYEFEVTLQALIFSTHDAHLNLIAGILGVFTFGTSYDIASVSLDGIQLPKVYFSDDLTDSASDGDWQPSAISKIDDLDAQDYLDDFAATNAIGSLESHADFNQLMTSPAQDIQSIFSTWGGNSMFYPGDELTFLLENGTRITTNWLAVYTYPSSTGALETGGDFYNFFVLGWYPASYDPNATESSTAAPTATETDSATSTADETAAASTTAASWDNDAYPDPDIAQADLGTFGTGFVSGYFLRQSSVAVLSLPSFQEPGFAVGSFSDTVTRFLNASKAAGMQKVVIDVQQNYGGDVFLAVDTYKQFFPTQEPFGGSRMRATDPTNAMGDAITGYWETLDDSFDDYYDFYDDEWMALTRNNADTNDNFTSWAEFYGPHVFNGDSFTTTQRYNFSDNVFSTISTEDEDDDGFTVYGTDARPANTTQPYAAKDVIILSDSLCSSACAVFMEMMHHEAGVRTVVAGGRSSYGPMQAPSMSRGAAAYTLDSLDYQIDVAQQLLQESSDPSSANFLPNRTTATDVWITYADINLRDQVRRGGNIPLQFVYEAATCRIFYTPQTFYNYTALWTYAADAMWNNPSLCVKDSTGWSTTSATNTTAPPASILPSPKPSASTDPKIGSIIMNVLSGSPPSAHSPILDDGIPTKQGQLAYEGTSCSSESKCPTTDYFCLTTSLKCDSKTKKPVSGSYCVPVCNPNQGGKVVNTCTNFGVCQPLNSTVPGFKNTGNTLTKGRNGYCDPPIPACRKTKKSKFTSINVDGALDPPEKRDPEEWF